MTKEILRYGLNRPVGGVPDKYAFLTKFEVLRKHWSNFARAQNVDPLNLLDIRAHMYIVYGALTKCYSDDKSPKQLREFLNMHTNICILPVDKSKNILITYLDDDISKLNDVFGDSTKFKKSDSDPIEKDLKAFRSLIGTLQPYLGKASYWKVQLNESIKKSFGLVKLHKPL